MFYVFLCIILWSFIPTFAKFAQTSLDHHQYLFYSSIVSFVSIFLIALKNKQLHHLTHYSKQTFLVLFALGFLDFFYYLLLYFGYAWANGLEVLVIQYLWPVFIVLLSLVILKEKLSQNKLLSMLFGFLGVCVVVTKGDIASVDLTNIKTLLIVMLGTLSFALFSVLGKIVKAELSNAVMIYFFSAILYSFISMSSFSSFVIPHSSDWFAIIINGVLLNGISYLFWIKALQINDASKVANYIFFTPVLSAFFLILFFDEEVYFAHFIGLGLVITSGLINTKKQKTGY